MVALLVLALILTGCGSGSAVKPDTGGSGKGLEGSWLWTESSGGFAGRTTAPPPGSKVVIAFGTDGEYLESANDSIRVTTRYTIRREKTIYAVDSLQMISFQDPRVQPKVILRVGPDSLSLG